MRLRLSRPAETVACLSVRTSTTAEAQAKAAKAAQSKGGSSTLGKDKGLKVGAVRRVGDSFDEAD